MIRLTARLLERRNLGVIGQLHSHAWGDFRAYFRFELAASAKVARLDTDEDARR